MEREDLHEDMQLLHADQVDPQSIDGIVEESIASRPRSINSDVAGVVSMLALIRVAQQSSAATIAKLTAAQKSQFDKLNDALTNQHSLLMKMVAGNTARDAQLAQHGKWMARVEILFNKLDQHLPTLARCVEACSEFGPTAEAVASTLANIRDHMVTTTQTVSQRLDGMEETIQDTFLDLKVDVIPTTLASLERTIATRFTVVDTALAQMASSPHAGVGLDRPPLRETPPTLQTPRDWTRPFLGRRAQ